MITYNKIGLNGRFGNQLFQYATLYAVARKLKFDFGVPFRFKSSNQNVVFYLPECFPNLSARDSNYSNVLYTAHECEFLYNSNIFTVSDNTDINGYFQSERYFIDYRKELLIAYTFNEQIQKKALDMRSLTNSQAISIHLRLGDYLNLQDCHPVCSAEYYQKALKMLPDDNTVAKKRG